MLQVGEKAPEFSGRDQDGREVDSHALLARGPVVLYFYPRDFTPGCTIEACNFRDAFADLDARGATIVGVSVDDEASHKRFADKHGLPFTLIADPAGALAKRFQATRAFGLGVRRVTYVIAPDGLVRGVFHHELLIGRHVADVQKALSAIAGAAV